MRIIPRDHASLYAALCLWVWRAEDAIAAYAATGEEQWRLEYRRCRRKVERFKPLVLAARERKRRAA